MEGSWVVLHEVEDDDTCRYDDRECCDECEFEWAEGFEVHGAPFGRVLSCSIFYACGIVKLFAGERIASS